MADPLPQALVLTAIVIGFATTGFVIELALRSRHETGSDHVDGHEPGHRSGRRQGRCGMTDLLSVFFATHLPVLPVLLPHVHRRRPAAAGR